MPSNPLLRAAQQSPPDYRSVREVTRPGAKPRKAELVRSPGRRPGRRRSWLALAALVAAGLLGGAGYTGVRWFQSKPAAQSAPAPSKGSEVSAVEGVSTTAPTRGSSAGTRAARVGVTSRDGDFAFKVTRIRSGGAVLGSGRNSVQATGRFVLVYVAIKNLSGRPQALLPTEQRLQDASARAYAANSTIPAAASRRIWAEVQPGEDTIGIMVFDVPKTLRVSTLLLQGSASSPGLELAVR